MDVKKLDPRDGNERIKWHLRLYIAGQTARSAAAMTNLKRICETHLAGRYDIEVIDLSENPKVAAADQILAVPTAVRKLPEPIRKVTGNLSDEQRVLDGLQIEPATVQDEMS